MKAKRLLMFLAAMAAVLFSLPIIGVQAASAASPSICYRAQVRGDGWQPEKFCDGDIAGTVGQSKSIDVLDIQEWGGGRFCVQDHVEGRGNGPVKCGGDGDNFRLGATGTSVALRLEAVRLTSDTRSICGTAHVQNIGWQPTVCGRDITIGTMGRSLRMEAVSIWFL